MLVKLKVDKAMSCMMNKLEQFLTCQGKTGKAAHVRLPVKDMIGANGT